MDIKIAQQEAITELVMENQKLKREIGEAREKYTTLLTENMLAVQKLCTERDAEREAARRWQKVASAFEILTPPVGARRIMKLAHRDGWRCAYCGVETCFTGRDGPRATVDHVVPKSKGGLNHMANCVVACEACNNAKADQEEWSPPEVDEPKAEIPKERLAGVSESNTENPKTWEWRDGMFRKKKDEE
jgi:5-methylcytosine-specific restriction endonuclease McrA